MKLILISIVSASILSSCASDTPITLAGSYETKDGQVISLSVTGTPKSKPALPASVTVIKPSGATSTAPLVSTSDTAPAATPAVVATK
ncbi:MAG: hypothetical protein QM755_23770 [Luteolibacter sp.]